MANVTIDGKTYDTENFSDEAKQHLKLIQATERKINDLKTEIAIMQTARNTYAKALSGELPESEEA